MTVSFSIEMFHIGMFYQLKSPSVALPKFSGINCPEDNTPIPMQTGIQVEKDPPPSFWLLLGSTHTVLIGHVVWEDVLNY